MVEWEKGWLGNLLSLVFPLRCVHCGRAGERLCAACRGKLEVPGPRLCRRCGRPTLYAVAECRECRGRRLAFTSAAAAFTYNGPARSLVHALKYSGQRRLAELMAELTLERHDLTGICKGATLSHVPMHRSRQASRGFNQAELYARALARRLEVPCRGLLSRRRPTLPQERLDLSQRKRNPRGSFEVPAGPRLRGPVVLVDDVYTTGSTASACASALRAALGVEVRVWTFARTVRH